MKLIDLLKSKRNKVVQLEDQVKDNKSTNTGNIKIVIENSCGAFDNEEKMIREGALKFLEMGKADDMEDAIITAATIIRGLAYEKTEKDDDGNMVITFRDRTINDTAIRK